MEESVKHLRRLDVLIDDVRREGRRTDRILTSLPPEFFEYSPSTELRSVQALIDHIGAIYLFCARAYRDDVWDHLQAYTDTPAANLVESGRMLTLARDTASLSIQSCSAEQLRAIVFPSFGRPEPAITFLRRALDHEIHHRGELCVYATLFGSPIEDIYECERPVSQ